MANNVQTRSEEQGLRYFITIREALDFAEKNPDVWKISFDAATGERVRMVRKTNGNFFYEPIDINQGWQI